MSHHQYRTKEFKDLKDSWYKKLKDDGFTDVEQSEDKLKLWDCHAFSNKKRHSKKMFFAKQKYFELAGQFLHSYTFKTDTERTIWLKHSEGETVRAIHTQMKSQKFTVKSHVSVYTIIKRLAKEMLEQYQNDDEND